ncbi:hypothetical protein COLO4_03471 [Corchorus olitorius]|uniref:Uncharacterized protein n=1 Tax=Corchorus olitorius TaxID=93759 RepID=A0A1R3KYE6_9ROSI|nr:hypothetical protein COLO4_03471 [Corchorus olitorius]
MGHENKKFGPKIEDLGSTVETFCRLGTTFKTWAEPSNEAQSLSKPNHNLRLNNPALLANQITKPPKFPVFSQSNSQRTQSNSMSDPIILLSDEDDPNTPLPSISKKARVETGRNFPPVLVLDDDPTPEKLSSRRPTFTSDSIPSFVAETPMSEPSVVRCSFAGPSARFSDSHLEDNKLSGSSKLICLESDDESESGSGRDNGQEKESKGSDIDESEEFQWRSRFVDYESHLGSPTLIHMYEDNSSQPSQPMYTQDDDDPLLPTEVNDDEEKENFSMEQMGNALKQKRKTKANSDKKSSTDGATVKKKLTKEERTSMLEEKKLKKEANEAELAEHVVGLTCSLASCQFRKKLTRLTVSANGAVIPKDSVDKNIIKDNLWVKALLAIPKVQPRFALAIWRKYPTMKSLLRVYMDPTKSVHEKEFLLKDLVIEGLLGNDRRLGEICSKRVYRILMAQSGSIKTDDVENGADFFRQS